MTVAISTEELYTAILDLLPMAELGEDNEGQVIIYTNCDYSTDGRSVLGPVTLGGVLR